MIIKCEHATPDDFRLDNVGYNHIKAFPSDVSSSEINLVNIIIQTRPLPRISRSLTLQFGRNGINETRNSMSGVE